MPGRRRALLVAADRYAEYSALEAPLEDARRLAGVLADPGIGGFEVRTLANERSADAVELIEDFFADAGPDDLLLLYVSGHGDQDEEGLLYFVAPNTRKGRLRSTALPAATVRALIDRCRAAGVVVLLDCCWSGRFPAGAKAGAAVGAVDVVGQLDPGRGCVVITATNEVEPAWEGVEDGVPRSVFTEALVEGLATGNADLDADGLIDGSELFKYLVEEVRKRDSRQTPTSGSHISRELVIARNRRGRALPPDLPDPLRFALLRGDAAAKQIAVQTVAALAARGDTASRHVLRQLLESDSDELRALAAGAQGAVVAAAPGTDGLDAAREDYLRWVVETHEYLRVPGLRGGGGSVRVPLDQVYVALRVDPTSQSERAAAHEMLLRDLEERLGAGDFTPDQERELKWLWQAELPVADHFGTARRLAELRGADDRLLDVRQLCERSAHTVVLGDPGSGKTTILRWLAAAHARALLAGADEVRVPLSKLDVTSDGADGEVSLGPPRLPVLARVADIAGALKRHSGETPVMLDLLAGHSWFGSVPVWSRNTGRYRQDDAVPAPLRRELVRRALVEGRALIMLDGLDEIADPHERGAVTEAVTDFLRQDAARRTGAGRNLVLVTSRIAGYDLKPLPADLTHVTVERLSDPAMAVFLRTWMREVLRGLRPGERVVELAERHTRDLLELIHRPDGRYVLELATNPLLAGTIATVYLAEGGQLPRQRVEVYQKAVDRLVEVWYERLSGAEVAQLKDHVFAAMRAIAHHIHQHKPSGVVSEPEFRDLFRHELARLHPDAVERMLDALLRAMRDEVGLLAQSAPGAYRFSHLTFQEFLAAQHLAATVHEDPTAVLAHLGDPHWREPTLMLLGLVNWRQPGRLAELTTTLLRAGGRLGDRFPESALLLATAFTQMTGVPEDVLTGVVDALLRSLTTLDVDGRLPEVRALVERAIGDLRDGEHRGAVDAVLVEALLRPAGGPPTARATARLVTVLGIATPPVVAALARAAATLDDEGSDFPIAAALAVAVSPGPDGSPRHDPRRVLPAVRMRDLLSRDRALLARIRADHRMLALVATLYGGYQDLGGRAAFDSYHRMANYLQLEDTEREGFVVFFQQRWGRTDPLMEMARHLDAVKDDEWRRYLTAPFLDPDAVVRHPAALHQEVLSALRRDDLDGLLHSLAAHLDDDSADVAAEAGAAIWALGGTAPADGRVAREVRRAVGALERVTRDATLRTAHLAGDALAGCAAGLDEVSWDRLYEAVTAVLLRVGAEPLAMPVDRLPEAALHRVLVEELVHRFHGWGDDVAYNAGTYGRERDEASHPAWWYVRALNDAASARHLHYPLYVHRWPADPAAFRHTDPADVPITVLDHLVRVPENFSLARAWMMEDVLPSVAAENPELVPELLAASLVEVRSRAWVQYRLGREFFFAEDQVEAVRALAHGLRTPWHRARALARLADVCADRRAELAAEAAAAVADVADPVRRFELHEWLARLRPVGEEHAGHVAGCVAAAERVADHATAVLAWLRVARLVPVAEFDAHVGRALARLAEVSDRADRVRLLRLVRNRYADAPRLREAVDGLVADLPDPLDRAWVREEWGAILAAGLPWLVGDDPARTQVWTPVVLNARAVDFLRRPDDERRPAGAVVRALDRDLHRGAVRPGAAATALGGLAGVDPDIEPVVRRWLAHPFRPLAATAALVLAEYRGMTAELLELITELDRSDNDSLRHRARLTHYRRGWPGYRTASYTGVAAMRRAVERADELAPTEPQVRQHLVWFLETIHLDLPSALHAWCDVLDRADGGSVPHVERTLLRSVQSVTEPVWRAVLARFRRGSAATRGALLVSICRMLHRCHFGEGQWRDDHDRHLGVDRDRWAEFWVLTRDLDPDGLAGHRFAIYGYDGVLNAVDAALTATGGVLTDEGVDLAVRYVEDNLTTSFQEILGQPEDTARELLRRAGEQLFARPYSVRQAVADYHGRIVEAGHERWDWVALLLRWMQTSPPPAVPAPDTASFPPYLHAYLLEVTAIAADLQRDSFRKHADPDVLEPLLVDTVRHALAFTSRSAAARMLGVLRRGSEVVLVTLLEALSDVVQVANDASDAIGQLRHIDLAVVDDLIASLRHRSALKAWAAAQALLVVGQMSALPDQTRQKIIDALAEAILDPASHRTVYFNHVHAAIPEMPQLDDAFAAVLRKVFRFA